MRRSWIYVPSAAAAGVTNTSIDMDGSTEYFKKASMDIGIADDWTISMWIRTDVLNATKTLFNMKGADNSNQIDYTIWGTAPNDPLRIYIWNSAGAWMKRYYWDSLFSVDTWYHLVLTWNGASGDVLKLYVDGTETAETGSYTDNAGAMTNTNRALHYGANSSGAATWDGYVSHAAMWDVVLDQDDVDQVFADKLQIDLTSNSGTYDKSANLIHYWRVGLDSADIGKDEGTAGDVDIMDDAANITSDDISTTVYPGA